MSDGQAMLFGGADEPPPPTPGKGRAAARASNRVEPVDVSEAHASIAARLPPEIRLGTSSWSFPGWRGIVWKDHHDAATLAASGLSAYSAHPLFGAVGIDRTFYGPVSETDFARYAGSVPDGFRFLVKAPQVVTQPWVQGSNASNDDFLDADLVSRQWLEPAARGLGRKLGVFVFQFTPLGSEIRPTPDGFLDRLERFLSRLTRSLPTGLPLAVEVRDAPLLTDRYRDILRGAGVDHCYNVHPKAGTLEEQAALFPPDDARRLVVRWMLGSGQDYESAREAFAPFNEIRRPDASSREFIAALARAAAGRGSEAIVIANNKAEGSSPLSVFRLAGRIVESM